MKHRYKVEQRIGMVAVIDTQHPAFDPSEMRLKPEYPWIKQFWYGYRDGLGHWCVPTVYTELAEELCKELNTVPDESDLHLIEFLETSKNDLQSCIDILKLTKEERKLYPNVKSWMKAIAATIRDNVCLQ